MYVLFWAPPPCRRAFDWHADRGGLAYNHTLLALRLRLGHLWGRLDAATVRHMSAEALVVGGGGTAASTVA